MLHFDIIDVSEEIDVNNTSESKACNIHHYWYFLDKGLQFPTDVCNGCHKVLMISMNHSDIVILNIKGADYCCIINEISKTEAINLLKKMLIWLKKAKHYKT